MVEPRFRWRLPETVTVPAGCEPVAARLGLSARVLRTLVARGVRDGAELERHFAAPATALHDPWLLPDAAAAVRRVAEARARRERVLVYGDFDADGLTGIAVLVLALRRLGLDVEPYVPERRDDGHGLSLRAIERAAAESRTLIVTTDCGTTSGPEIELAAERGIATIVTDHHHAATWPAAALAVVNPHRPDGAYPDRRLTGAGVAWKVAQLLLGELTVERDATGLPAGLADLADLAVIGTVADVAPVLGENRAIARLGLERLRATPRPGLAALMHCAGVPSEGVDLEQIAFALAPRLNAAGRVGEAGRAERLLLCEDPAAAEELAAEIEGANAERRALTQTAVAEARAALAPDGSTGGEAGAGDVPLTLWPVEAGKPAVLVVRGEWPVGIIGLIAGRLAEDAARPAVVATLADPEAGILRASCRSPRDFDLAAALVTCGDLFIRHGGHAAAAGFDIQADRWPEFEARFRELAGAVTFSTDQPELQLDLVLPAPAVDFALLRELASLEPCGPGNPAPLLAVTGLTVMRARAASGGHTQLVLRRERDVLDAIAFRRPDLAGGLPEGTRVDVAARAASRRFGGFESIQLEVLDVAPERQEMARAARG